MPTGSVDRPEPVTAPYARILLATEHTEFDSGAERVAFDLALRWGAPLAAVEPLVTNAEYEAVAPELAERRLKVAPQKVRQHEAIVQLGAPALQRPPVRFGRVRRGDRAHEQHLRGGHPLVRRHLEGAQLDQTKASGGAVR